MTDLSLRESLRKVHEYLAHGKLNTICYVDTDLMIKLKDDEDLKAAIQDVDILIPENIEILKAGGIISKSREKEVKGNFFLRELIKMLAKEKKKVFLITDTQDGLVSLREQLLKIDNRLTFFGSYAYDDLAGTDDAIINEVNSVIPDVIISQAASPSQELLMSRSRFMMNARLWIALQDMSTAAPAADVKGPRKNIIHAFFSRLFFRKAVNNYESEDDT